MPIWFHLLWVVFLLYKFKKYTQIVRFIDKRVLITGGSSGIGEALAKEFVNLGAFVIITGRNLSELNRVKTSLGPLSNKVEILQLDLSNADEAYKQMKEFLSTQKIDILINNAGRSQRGEFLDDLNSLKVERILMEVNYFSVIALSKAAYEAMNENGHIVVISSMAGVIGSPYRTSYSASKFAVGAYFDSLYQESSKVFTTVVYPGYVQTNLSKNAVDSKGGVYGKTVDNTKKGMSPESVAKIIVKAVFNKETHVFITDLKTRVALFLNFWVPSVTNWFLYKYGKKVKADMNKAR